MMDEIRNCLHKKYVRIFEHNFVADKEKIRRHIPREHIQMGNFSICAMSSLFTVSQRILYT